MKFGHKAIYAVLLSGNYTAMVAMSFGTKYFDILLTTIILSVIAYGWLLYSIKQFYPFILNYVDILLNIFIYTFISFSIAFMALTFAALQFNWWIIALLASPTIVWVVVWCDLYVNGFKRSDKYFVKTQ